MNAKKDDNAYPTLIGISCVDGVTPVRVAINPSNGAILVDTTTVISVTPAYTTQVDGNDMPIGKGVSSTNENVILPWYVHPDTGAVLIET